MSTRKPRRFTTRRTVAATAAVAAVGASAAFSVQLASADESTPEAMQACAMETLPIPEGLPSTSITAMSDDGSVIAYVARPLDQSDPDGLPPQQLLYSDGELTEVPMLNDYAVIREVNSAGVGVGWTFRSPNYVPYVWRDGELSELPTVDGGSAHAINEHGDIVGSRDGDRGPLPVVWPADGSGPVDLRLPDHADWWGEAMAVGDDGTVLGHYGYEEGDTLSFKPYIWQPDGTGTELPAPDGIDPADARGEVTDMNGDWASGYGWGADTNGIRWNLAEGTAEMTELDDALAVSAEGTVAGHIADSPIAAYQSGETVVELPGIVDPADNYAGDAAKEISADGSLIAGDVFVGTEDAEGSPVTNAVTWTCG